MKHIIIWSSSLLIFCFYLFINPNLDYFSDSAIKWRQIVDYSHEIFSCTYPGINIDDKMLYIPSRFYIVYKGSCNYFFPFATTLIYLPAFKLFGNYGILLTQFLISILILYNMYFIGNKLGLNNNFLFISLLIWEFGTGNILAMGDIEDHSMSTFLFISSLTLIFFNNKTSLRIFGYSLIPITILFRPEMLILGPLFPIATYLQDKKESNRKKIPLRNLIQNLPILIIGYSVIIFLNIYLSGKPLGFKQYDDTNNFTNFWDRIYNLKNYILFNWPLVTNALLSHMPLILLIPFLYFQKNKDKNILGKIKSIFILFLSIIPILLISPLYFGGPYLGVRFIAFLYPIIILFIFISIQQILAIYKNIFIKFFFVISILYTLSQSILLLGIGFSVFTNYKKINILIINTPGEALIIKDQILESSLYSEYYKRPIFLVKNDSECKKVISLLKEKGVKTVSLLEHTVGVEKKLNCSEYKIESKIHTDTIDSVLLKLNF